MIADEKCVFIAARAKKQIILPNKSADFLKTC
jgi:hypothetical protein